MIKRFAAASLIALLPAQALAANWVSTSVDAFTVPQPKTYGAECAGPSNGVFANVKDTKTFTGVSIDEDINCVKFTYNGAEYFVHATQVAHPPLGAITVDACKMLSGKALALNQSRDHVEHASMGAGTAVDPKKCK